MGATNFTAYASGRTVQEAFSRAVQEAKYDHGKSGYTGTIAEKESNRLIEITVPKAYKGKEKQYVETMQWDKEEELMDKWGPTGYIKLGGRDLKELVPDKVKRHHGKTDGPRKWESLYMVYADGEERSMEVDFSKFKDEAVKKAVAYTKETECSTNVVLVKRLVNQDPIVFTANMSYKEVTVKNAVSDYVFFGMASD